MTDTADLVARLAGGDEQALAEVYDLYGGAVYHFVLRITHDPALAEEVCLDSFLQLWQQSEKLDERGGNLRGWLFTIARSRAIDRIRMAGTMRRTPSPASPAAAPEQPEEKVDRAERRQIVRRALESLSPPQRAALQLAYYEGLSHSEIARHLGEPLGTVKTRIRQAMIVLRNDLATILSRTS